MIYTVTFNPALDYVVKLAEFLPGEINRTREEQIFYGGKGINVSAVLANLGVASTAWGFVAGFTGEELYRGAGELGFQADFIRVKKGMTRINVKIKAGTETEINGAGPDITAADVNQLMEKMKHLKAEDWLVLSGSIPSSISDTIYEEIMERESGTGVRVVVDATCDLLLNVLQYRPFLIKPNNHELGEMFGAVLKDEADIIRHAKILQDRGARNVLVSMAGDGAILITEDHQIIRRLPPAGIVKNSVGAGDSMVAGFLSGYLKTGSYEAALCWGTAAGSASAFSEGLATGDDIRTLYQKIHKEVRG